MFNSYGWIQLGFNRKNFDFLDEDIQQELDKKDELLCKDVRSKLNELIDKNEMLRFDIEDINNLSNFLNVRISTNHSNETLRSLFKWISEISDGSHGVLYEIDDERNDYDPKKPYKIFRLIGNEFEKCEELLLNEKFHTISDS
jgi:hypothetical protein